MERNVFIKWDSMPHNHSDDRATLRGCLLPKDQGTDLSHNPLRVSHLTVSQSDAGIFFRQRLWWWQV